MRLFYLINGLGPGGAERSLAELLPYYAQAGIETTVVCLRSREHNAEDVIASGARLLFAKSTSFSGWVPEIRRLLRKEAPDLLHTTIFQADVVGRIAAAGTGVPVLTSLVNTAYDQVRLQDPSVRRMSFLATREIDGVTSRHLTTHFHAITEAVRDSAVRSLRIRTDQITVIPRGRDPGRLGEASAQRKMEARRMLGLEADIPVLVNVGRQEFQKGQTHLLDAMAIVRRKVPHARLLIVGREGHASENLQAKMREHALGGHVEFLGFRTDIPDVLAAADLFVFPSLYEGLGGSLIEAMALRLPVVASDISALREVVDDGSTGYLVPVGNAPALASRIIELLGDPARSAAFGAQARRMFDDRFTIRRSADRMIELYRTLGRS